MSTLSQFVGGRIKSVQRGIISVVNGTTSGTATITSVDTSKSVVSYLGFTNTGSAGAFRLQLTNSTTVTAIRYGIELNSSTVEYQVVEYY